MKSLGWFVALLLSALLTLAGVALILRGLLGIVDAMFPDPAPRPEVTVTRADFPLCVTVKPPPIRAPQKMQGRENDGHSEIV